MGVQCAGNPHFWVSEDGLYQEEGMTRIQGSIWGTVWFLRILSFIIDVLLVSLNFHVR